MNLSGNLFLRPLIKIEKWLMEMVGNDKMIELKAFKEMARRFLEEYNLNNLVSYRVWDPEKRTLIRKKGSPTKLSNSLKYYDIGVIWEV